MEGIDYVNTLDFYMKSVDNYPINTYYYKKKSYWYDESEKVLNEGKEDEIKKMAMFLVRNNITSPVFI